MSNGLPEDDIEGGREAALAARVAELEAKVAALEQAMLARPALPPPPVAKPFSVRTAYPSAQPSFAALGQTLRTARTSGSLESDIGSKVLSKVAILLLLAGTAWFLKWAFDNRWIGPTGRIVIGLAAGAGIILWSERFRKSGTPSFAYALKAVGSGVLYLSLWAAFQLYHLVPAPVALAAMIAVTAWNAVLALTQDSRLLAGYALLGAYVTPVLLSTGGNHEVFLFSYLGSIAIAVAVLLHFKRWNLLLLAPVPVTTAFFIVWWVVFSGGATYWTTGCLAMMLWAIFAATSLIAQDLESVLVAVLQPIAAATFGACAMYSVLIDSGHRDTEPWVALGFAAAYLGLSRLRRPSLLSAIHLSLAISFITIAIPLKLTGHGITVGWLAEALAVLMLAAKVNFEARARGVLAWLGLGAMVLGTLGALMGPSVFATGASAFVNRTFATQMGAVMALAAAIVLYERIPDQVGPVRKGTQAMLLIMLNVVLLSGFWREIHRAFGAGETQDFAYSGWIAFQGAAMLAFGFWRRVALARWMGLLLLAATIVKTVVYDMRQLETGFRIISYLALGGILMLVSYAYQKDWLGLHAAIRDDEAEEQA